MNVSMRRLVSEEEVKARLDVLALRYGISEHCYDESASESMSEFDALKWVSLCSQRIALSRRGHELPPLVSSPFLGIYKNSPSASTARLRNSTEGLSKLAA